MAAVLALCSASVGSAQAAPAAQFRDLTFQLPSADWHTITPDPSKDLQGRRALFGRAEAYHELRLIVHSEAAPPLLAPSEVVDQWVAEQKKTVDAGNPDGTYSDFTSGTRSLAGRDYPSVSARFTPSSGPPITDETFAAVFPSDFAQRERWTVVEWADVHSATVDPLPLDELASVLSSLEMRPLGTLLAADDFADSDNGVMRAPQTDHYTVGYMDAEYQVQKTDPDWSGGLVAYVAGTFYDYSVGVDVYVANAGEPGPVEFVFCRSTDADGSYRASVDPIRSQARLERIKPDNSTDELAAWARTDALNVGSGTNHLEMTCRGNLVALDVNGTRVAEARTSDLFRGSAGIGGGTFAGSSSLPDIRFANLKIVQR